MVATDIRVKVDEGVCFGSGECVMAAPQAFELSADGVAVYRSDAPAMDQARIEAIVDNCPSGALSIHSAGAAGNEIPMTAEEEQAR